MKISVIVSAEFALVREGIVRALNSDPAIEVVAQAENGNDALRLAEKLTPDVMILDLRMADPGGLAVLDKLRTSRPSIRVIFMTASEHAGTLLDAIAAGAAGYLSKRSTTKELRQAVITAHGGGSVIAPSLASHLLEEFSSPARGEQSQVRPLHGRELDVLRLVLQGKTHDAIGKELSVSPRTVQNHLTRIRWKTGLRSRPEEPPDEGGAAGGVREPRRRPPDGGSAWASLRPQAGT